MSEWRDRYEESPGLADALAYVESYYHYGVIAVLAVFMLWLRVRHWGRFLVDGEVLFNGNDPWYHFRNIVYTVDHYPQTMPFEVFTNFPQGTTSGQFGTFYDQIIATIALVVGLGNPSEQLVAMVALFAPVAFAMAAILPTYYIARRMGGRAGAVTAIIVIGLSAGAFLTRSWVGTVDHHIAELLFQAVAILGMMVAVSVAARDKPIIEQLVERDITALRPTIGWSALAGVAVAMYIWVWPFGIFLIGILGVYFLVQLSAEFLRGESPEHTAIAGAIAMGVTTVLLLGKFQSLEFSSSQYSLLQVGMPLGLGLWCLGMAGLARVWERRDLPTWGYPASVLGVLVVGILAMRLVLPSVYGLFETNFIRILGLGFGVSEQALSVGEISPLGDPATLFSWFKFAIIAALIGVTLLLARFVAGRKVRSEHVLVLVWAIIVTIATFTQERFAYYMFIPVAVLSGYLVGRLVDWFSLEFSPDVFEFFRVAAIVAIAVMLIVPMVVVTPTPMLQSGANAPGGGVQGWSESLEWVDGNTPAEGEFGDASNEMDYDGTYSMTDDYDYPDGAFGILSWWDYGHWITVQSERIPVANPFQQHATEAANFLLAPDEEQAADVLSNVSEDDAETRYIMADWKMVNTYSTPTVRSQAQRINGKFFAPVRFYDRSDVSDRDYWGRLFFEQQTSDGGGALSTFNYKKQPYYESMVVRLYRYHGSAVEPQPVVMDWSTQQSQVAGQRLPMTWSGAPQPAIQSFDNMSAAREFVREDGTAQVGGFGGNPPERVPALEHYRLVGSSELDASQSRDYQLTKSLTSFGLGVNRTAAGPYFDDLEKDWTKVFERVPGATIEGSGPANANVTAAVQMRNHVSNENFTYTQRVQTDDSGEFTMTVPYSTSDYDEWGVEEGRTNVSVRANNPYQFTAFPENASSGTYWTATSEVPEGAVIGETDEPITVEMEQQELQIGTGETGNGDESQGRVAPTSGVAP